MKNTLTILFLIVYILLGAGVNVIVHTCGGVADASLASVQFDDPCGCGDDDAMSEMCCTTEMTTVKLEDAQQASSAPTLQPESHGQLLHAVAVPSTLDAAFTGITFFDTSPPLTHDLTVLHSVFRI